MNINYLLIIMGLTSIVPLFAMQPEQPMVTLESADGAQFQIPLAAAQESGQLRDLLSASIGQEAASKKFEFKSISTPVMAEVVELLKALALNKDTLTKKDFFEHLKSVRVTNLKGVLEAADFLDISLIKQIIAYQYAQQLSSKQLSYPALQQKLTQAGLHPELVQDLLRRATIFYYVFNPDNRTLQESPYGTSIQDYLDFNPQLITERRSSNKLDLTNMYLSSLEGLRNIPNISSVTSLWLIDNKLQQIQQNIFDGLYNLQSLNLRNNQLQQIQSNAFIGLQNLQLLDLADNKLHQIQPNAFNGLQNLEKLELQDNQLQQINPQVFAGLQNLQGLFLYNNLLTSENITAILTALPELAANIAF